MKHPAPIRWLGPPQLKVVIDRSLKAGEWYVERRKVFRPEKGKS